MEEEKLAREFRKAKLQFHNAVNHLRALELKMRRKLGRIATLRSELGQAETGLPALTEKLDEARMAVHLARLIYRPLRGRMKAEASIEAENLQIGPKVG